MLYQLVHLGTHVAQGWCARVHRLVYPGTQAGIPGYTGWYTRVHRLVCPGTQAGMPGYTGWYTWVHRLVYPGTQGCTHLRTTPVPLVSCTVQIKHPLNFELIHACTMYNCLQVRYTNGMGANTPNKAL